MVFDPPQPPSHHHHRSAVPWRTGWIVPIQPLRPHTWTRRAAGGPRGHEEGPATTAMMRYVCLRVRPPPRVPTPMTQHSHSRITTNILKRPTRSSDSRGPHSTPTATSAPARRPLREPCRWAPSAPRRPLSPVCGRSAAASVPAALWPLCLSPRHRRQSAWRSLDSGRCCCRVTDACVSVLHEAIKL
jgi:hypothetical protein